MNTSDINLRERFIKIHSKTLQRLYPGYEERLGNLPEGVLEEIVVDDLSLTHPKVVSALNPEGYQSTLLRAFTEYPFITKYWGLEPSDITDHQAEMLVSGQSIYSVLGEPTSQAIDKQKLDKLEEKKVKHEKISSPLQVRVQSLYPNFSEMYPQVDISTLPENQLERIVSGIPLYEVFGFSSNPLYSSLQLQEQEDAKLKHRTAYSGNGRSPKTSQVRTGNKGSSDMNYYG